MKNVDAFKDKYEKLEEQVRNVKEAAELAAKQATQETEFQTRFTIAVGEQKWRDELIQNAAFSEIKRALSDETNKGKGDKDILDALTKDKNYFTDPSKNPGFAGSTGSGTDYNVEESKMRAVMGLTSITENK